MENDDATYQSFERSSDSWNVAGGFVSLKILKPLVEIDKLVAVAVYGAEQIDSSLYMSIEQKCIARIEAISRIVDTLKTIIENSFFAMKRAGTLGKIKEFAEDVQKVEDVLSAIKTESVDMRTSQKSISINEEHFNNCLIELRRIKKDITKPLDENGLIFPISEETDLDTIKEKIIEGG